MNRLFRTATYSLLALGAAVTTHLQIQSTSGPVVAGVGSDPADASWELRRLRDPATGRIPDRIRTLELEYAATLPARGHSSQLLKIAGVQDYDWSRRGPYNIGGRTRALALDVSGEDTILAGSVTGGMWRSSNAGATWTKTTLPTQLASVTSITQDRRPGKTATWYYGTGELSGASGSAPGAYFAGDGIFKSTDNGRSWSVLPVTSNGTPFNYETYDFIWNVATDRSNQNEEEVYAAVWRSIARSTNGGATWSEVLKGTLRTSYYTDVAVTDSGVVYATQDSTSSRKGIFRSTTGASGSWTAITPPGWPKRYQRIVIGIAPSNPNVVYFLAETPGYGKLGKNFRGDSSWNSLWKYTYVSGDGSGTGGIWEDRSANLPSFGKSFGDFFCQGSYDLVVRVKPDNENVVYIGGTNLYRSTDGFATSTSTAWIGGYQDIQNDSLVIMNYGYPGHHPDQHAVEFSPRNPRVMYTGSDGGVHRTDDDLAPNVSWTSLNNGYMSTQFYTVTIDHATPGDATIVGGMQDNGTWRTSGSQPNLPWIETGSGDGSFCAMADGRTSLYVSKQLGKVYRVVLDPQGNVTGSTRIDPQGGSKYLFINPFALDPSNNKSMFLAGGVHLWRNSDLTAIPLGSTQTATVNWSRLEKSKVSDSTWITAIGISKENPSHRVYYGTENGLLYRLDDAGSGDPAPSLLNPGTFPKNAYINCIAVDPLDADHVIVVFSNYNVQSLFETRDGGETWRPAGGNLEQRTNGTGNGPSCRWVSILHRPNGTLYLCATSTGLYSTARLDSVNTRWELEGPTTIGNTVVDMIDIRQSDGFVVVGTHGAGIFNTTIATVGIDDRSSPIAETSMLGVSYPNPASSRVTIPFTVPSGTAPETVSLKVYDMRGAELTTLVEKPLPAGRHEAVLNLGVSSSKFQPGTYICRLQIGDEVETRFFTVVR